MVEINEWLRERCKQISNPDISANELCSCTCTSYAKTIDDEITAAILNNPALPFWCIEGYTIDSLSTERKIALLKSQHCPYYLASILIAGKNLELVQRYASKYLDQHVIRVEVVGFKIGSIGYVGRYLTVDSPHQIGATGEGVKEFFLSTFPTPT